MNNKTTLFVVKSVNTTDKGDVMTDENGIGIFLSMDEAKECFKTIVDDLLDLYNERYERLGIKTDVIVNGTFEFYAREESDDRCVDYVIISEVPIGKWNAEEPM